jgi:hypothetical protein
MRLTTVTCPQGTARFSIAPQKCPLRQHSPLRWITGYSAATFSATLPHAAGVDDAVGKFSQKCRPFGQWPGFLGRTKSVQARCGILWQEFEFRGFVRSLPLLAGRLHAADLVTKRE